MSTRLNYLIFFYKEFLSSELNNPCKILAYSISAVKYTEDFTPVHTYPEHPDTISNIDVSYDRGRTVWDTRPYWYSS